MAEITTQKIVGGRYQMPDGKFVDCNGYSLDGNDKEREIAQKIAELQAQLNDLQAQNEKPLPVLPENAPQFPVPEPRLEAGSISAQTPGQLPFKVDKQDEGKDVGVVEHKDPDESIPVPEPPIVSEVPDKGKVGK